MKTITIDGVKYAPTTQRTGDTVMVRTRSAGVFYGILTERNGDDWLGGTDGRVLNARRVWYWDGAASLSELAARGPSKPETCKFPVVVEWVDLTDIIEVLPVTDEALVALDGVPVWTQT